MNLLDSITLTFSAVLTIGSTNAAAAQQQVERNVAAKNGINLHGAAVVYKKGTRVFSHYRGMANASWNIHIDKRTRFRIGSVTKPITAMIILELESQKKLSLTDSIKKWLPDESIVGSDKITIHHLLSHTSGLYHFPNGKRFENLRADIQSPDELVKLFYNKPLEFSPGSKWGYSNANFVVLGLIAEQVSGQSYLELVNAYVAQPARLSKTSHEERYEIVPHLALPYYLAKNGSYSGLPHVSPVARFGAGSIYSSADDMAKWIQYLIAERGSSGRIFRKMTKPRISLPDGVAQKAGVPPKYAYGWFVGELDVLGCKTYVVEHGGSILGYSSKLRYFPDHDTIISVTSNTTQNIENVVNQLSYQFLDSTLCKS